MPTITIIFTCHNRIEKTRKCLETIEDDELDLSYIIVDDGCSDGTGEMIEIFLKSKKRDLKLIRGDGNLYWAGGMRMGIGYYLDKSKKTDYVCLLNDDVVFVPDVLKKMLERSKRLNDAVIVGVTSDSKGKMTYGGVRCRKGTVKYELIPIEKADEEQCDTFNCNCILLKDDIIRETGNFDEVYTHALADYDYGFTLKRHKVDVYETDTIIGVCEWPQKRNTWQDVSLSRKERLRLKETPKGIPRKEWYHYLRKNFGVTKAVWHSITPYIRIIMAR